MYSINYLVQSSVPTCDIYVFIVQSSVLFSNMHVQFGIQGGYSLTSLARMPRLMSYDTLRTGDTI